MRAFQQFKATKRDDVRVVVDASGRHALWPGRSPVPLGWREIAPATDHASATVLLEKAWTDMRPAPASPLAEASVPGRLSALARQEPGRPAILFGDRDFTRGELDELSARVAAAVAKVRAESETIVAVALGRSPEAIAAYLGVMRAGAAFLPIDLAHPIERNAFMLEQSGAVAILSDAASRERLRGLPPLDIIDMATLPDDGACDVPLDAGRLAYVIYTSGSTGKPKGVAVEHGPLAMHIETTAAAYDMSAASRELHFLTFAFDGAHERWMAPLWAGGSIALRGDELWTPAETLAIIRNKSVTHAGFPTSYIGELAAWAETVGDPPDVYCYSFGGEAMSRTTFERIGRALRPRILINGYGPTETVISPLIWKVSPGAAFDEPYAPIGDVVGDRVAYVLGPDLELTPEGATGELWLGGSGLARGYLKQPALTAERFLPDPFSTAGGRMYRTGDMVRRRADGGLAFVGREDSQVKIRGFRVELGEIEARLRAEPTVGEAVVLKRDGRAGPTLVGYVTPAPGRNPEPGRLRARLAGVLPAPLRPSRIVVLDRLPMTPNGKIDRAALPEPALSGLPPRSPSTPVEREIAALWSSILDLSDVGADQPFFELGGDSLSALRLLARLHLAYPGSRLCVADLLGNPTVETLAARINAGADPNAGEGPARVIHLSTGGDRPPLVLFPGLLVSLREYEALLRRLGPRQPAFGFACASLTHAVDALPEVGVLADGYAAAIRRNVDARGCTLLGWSWGGVLAFETARRLAGHIPVHFVGMADVCGLEAPFAANSAPRPEEAERHRWREMIDTWLAVSPMRDHWLALRARMDDETEDCFLRFMAAEPQPLPIDGPLVGSRERVLHTLVDHALQMRRLTLAPQNIRVRSFEAERSRVEGKPIMDWSGLASTVSVETIPATDHLDIVLSRNFHERLAQMLAEHDAGMVAA